MPGMLSPFLLIFVVLALILVMLPGMLCGARQKGEGSFSLGGRKAGTGLVAGAIVSSSIGGGATIGTAQLAFTDGLVAWCFTLGLGLGLGLLGLFYARRLRESGLETVPQFLALRYGASSEPVVGLISCCGIFFACASSVLPGIGLLASLIGMPPWEAGFLLMALMLAYVLVGGQKGAGLSGLLKSALLWLALAYAAYGAWQGIHGNTAATPAMFSLFSRGASYTWSCLGAASVGVITAQMYIQALFSAVNIKAAVRGAYLGAAITIPVGLMASLVGIFMRLHHPETPPILALPYFLLLEMPPWAGGLALGGILLCVISSAAVQSLSMGTMISRDLIGSILHIQNERFLQILNRSTIIFSTVLVVWFCLIHFNSSILTWNYLSVALRGGGIFLPLTLAVFCRRSLISPTWVMISMLLSTACSLVAATQWNMPPLGIGLASSALTLLVGWAIGRAKKNSPAP